MRQLLDLYRDIMTNGVDKPDRTGVGTRSVFGRQLRFDMADGFPAVTTKTLYWKGVVAEALWLLRGETNIKFLVDNDVNIWNDWPLKNYNASGIVDTPMSAGHFSSRIKADLAFATQWGYLGPVYGKQWRDWDVAGFDGFEEPGIDQLDIAVDLLLHTPDSRRIIITAWNPADIDEMAKSGLPPCHFCMQFVTTPMPDRSGGFAHKLNLHLNIRSSDVFLGLPFNIACYALILKLMALEVGMSAGELVVTTADTHIYSNHFEAVQRQLEREPFPLPSLSIHPAAMTCSILARSGDANQYRIKDFALIGYRRHEAIKAAVAV